MADSRNRILNNYEIENDDSVHGENYFKNLFIIFSIFFINFRIFFFQLTFRNFDRNFNFRAEILFLLKISIF